MFLAFFQTEDGVSFFSNILNLVHLHFLFAVLFLLSYSIKSFLFLVGNSAAFLSFKKKTIVIETLFSVGFLVFGFWMLIFHIKSGAYAGMHWLDPKIMLAILGIPLGIVGFKKGSKKLVALSLAFFYVALIIGLMHYR
ncbi:MAG: hypothetical protein KDD21_03625 [Bacteroidetes bacterium]|nr:hypothetical protein [Bacteroidota bacterium]